MHGQRGRVVGRIVLRARLVAALGLTLLFVATTVLVTTALIVLLDRVDVDNQTTAITAATRRGEGLQQACAQTLARHLDEAERGHLGDLVTRAVAAERLLQTAQHQILVFRQHHVDEVDDDHAAQIAQTHLADDFLSGLQVVASDRLFQVSASAGELTGVDVDDRHGLGAVDDQRAARRQPDLAVECLGQLLIDAEVLEDISAAVLLGEVALQTRLQLRCQVADVVRHCVPRTVALHHKTREVLVEDVADDLDQHIRLFVQRNRLCPTLRLRRLGGFPDFLPLRFQALNVGFDGLLGHALGRGANNRARALRRNLAQNRLQALALRLRQLAGNTRAPAARHVHQESTSHRNVGGQTRTLVTNRVLGHLDQNLVAGLQRMFNLARTRLRAQQLPVQVTYVNDTVAVGSDINERRFHAGQDVLHATEVDIANLRGLRVRGNEVLDQQVIFQHTNLSNNARVVMALALTHHHRALHRLTASQELSLRDHVALARFLTTLDTATALRLQASRALNRLRLFDLLAGFLFLPLGVLSGVFRLLSIITATPTSTTATARPRLTLRFA